MGQVQKEDTQHQVAVSVCNLDIYFNSMVLHQHLRLFVDLGLGIISNHICTETIHARLEDKRWDIMLHVKTLKAYHKQQIINLLYY